MMSLLLDPNISSNVATQATQLSYIIRNLARISGEKAGLPQSIPDHRKADYLFRDYYMTFVMTSLMDVSTRIAETRNVMPAQIKLLRLDRLATRYAANGIHTPKLPSFFQVKNYYRDYPEYVRNHILGYNVNPRSYWLVPELIEKRVIPQMLQKFEHPSKITEARLFAHHLRRLFTPEHYVDNFLLANQRITAEEAKILKQHIGRFKQFLFAYDNSRKTGDASKLLGMLRQYHQELEPLKQSAWLSKMVKLNPAQLLEQLQGMTLGSLFTDIFRNGLRKTIRNYQQTKILHPDRFMIRVHEAILRPLATQNATRLGIMDRLARSFTRNQIRAYQAVSVFKASELWLKIPLSFGLLTLLHGVVSGYIDVKYIQSFQDQLVKLRGDAKDTEVPTYLGTIAGLALGITMYRSQFIRRLGHVGSYLAAAVGYNVGQLGTTWWLLKRQIARPKNPQQYKIVAGNPSAFANNQPVSQSNGVSGATDIKSPRFKARHA